MEIDEKDDAEKSDECGSNDVQACLLERSVHALYLYQCIKPGILTESGFNICKLLVLNKRVNENVIKDSLDLMLKEKHDVMSWLDKVRLKFSIQIYGIFQVTSYKLKQSNKPLLSKINIIYILQDSSRFQNPVKHLNWSQWLKAVKCFSKNLYLRLSQVSGYTFSIVFFVDGIKHSRGCVFVVSIN